MRLGLGSTNNSAEAALAFAILDECLTTIHKDKRWAVSLKAAATRYMKTK